MGFGIVDSMCSEIPSHLVSFDTLSFDVIVIVIVAVSVVCFDTPSFDVIVVIVSGCVCGPLIRLL